MPGRSSHLRPALAYARLGYGGQAPSGYFSEESMYEMEERGLPAVVFGERSEHKTKAGDHRKSRNIDFRTRNDQMQESILVL